jgi:parvulin-like peptidyl-prolyl isomerase
MRTKVFWTSLVAIALLSGLAASELLYRSFAFRDLAGRLTDRGRLVAIVNGTGIYETDLGGAEEATAADLIVAENLRRVAAQEKLEPARLEQELLLIKVRFPSERTFEDAVEANGFSIPSLREKIAAELRARQWLERQIAPAITVTEQECRQFYDSHQDLFAQPHRFRASHLFLAAPGETLPEVVEEKELGIAALADRLAKGEDFSALAAEASEDEATKLRGGDLGVFSESRMDPGFIAEIQKLRVGELSKPFRSSLGFHIVRMTDIKSGRVLAFEETRSEISVALANERRAVQAPQIAANLRISE